MNMHGVRIVGPITEDETVAHALSKQEFSLVRILFPVDQLAVELAGPARNLFLAIRHARTNR